MEVGNVGYRKTRYRTAYSPATQNEMLANFCPGKNKNCIKRHQTYISREKTHLDKSALVDQLAHRLEVGSSPGDVRLWEGQVQMRLIVGS